MNFKQILSNINAGVILISTENESFDILYSNEWIEAYAKKSITPGTSLFEAFELSQSERAMLNRKVKSALFLNAPSFLSAEHEGYLIPITNQKITRADTFPFMQQDAAIMPYDTEKQQVALIIYDFTSLMISQRDLRDKQLELEEAIKELKKAHKNLAEKTALIDYQANFDSLTGLANRVLLQDRFERAIANAQRTQTLIGAIYIDLDFFKPINDTYGHSTGDKLLKMAGDVISLSVRKSDTVSRIGGDEFVVLLPNINDLTPVIKIAENILNKLGHPFTIGDHHLRLSASLGIATYPANGENPSTLIKNADIAMYHAKRIGRNSYQIFEDCFAEERMAQTNLEQALRKALSDPNFISQKGFSVVFQPKVKHLKLGVVKTVGVEALIRWTHPEHGIVSPEKFIPLAEAAGLVSKITQFVFHESCKYLKLWRVIEPDFMVSVNLSAYDFDRPNFCQELLETLKYYELPPSAIDLEITEHNALLVKQDNYRKLNDLRNFGFKLSLDDFGTGYSSLSFLAQIPVHTLKIDKEFVYKTQYSPTDKAMLESIIKLAHSFKLDVIAEGVETIENLEQLESFGGNYFQGYFFSKPLEADAITVRLQQEKEHNF